MKASISIPTYTTCAITHSGFVGSRDRIHSTADTSEFWFFLYILNGRMTYGNPSADPSAKLPRPAFLLVRELKFKTGASASFRGIDSLTVFLVLRRSHGEFPRKLFVGVAWKCVVCPCRWAGHCGTMFLVVLAGESGTIFHDPIFHIYRWAGGLSVRPRES